MSQLVPPVAVTLGGRERAFRCTMNTLAFVRRETGENLLGLIATNQQDLLPLRIALEAAESIPDEAERARAKAEAQARLDRAAMGSQMADPVILRALITGLLQHEKPAPSIDQVGDWITSLDEVLIVKAWEAVSLFTSGGRKPEADAPANPSTAA